MGVGGCRTDWKALIQALRDRLYARIVSELRVDTAAARTVIAGPATVCARAGPVSRTMARSAVVRLSAVGWTEIVEQKRERERNPETNTLGTGGELTDKNQGADGEENQRPFHLRVSL